MTIAVDWDVKHQTKQMFLQVSMNANCFILENYLVVMAGKPLFIKGRKMQDRNAVKICFHGNTKYLKSR